MNPSPTHSSTLNPLAAALHWSPAVRHFIAAMPIVILFNALRAALRRR